VSVLFPAVKPTDRQFKAPEWPTTSSRTQSGVTTRRRWGSRPGNAELRLEFRNIDDDRAADILLAHHAAGGASEELLLPGILFHGASGRLALLMRAGGLRWHFSEEAGAPVIVSVAPGISTTNVVLLAELNYS
jgi:hypothetical protein